MASEENMSLVKLNTLVHAPGVSLIFWQKKLLKKNRVAYCFFVKKKIEIASFYERAGDAMPCEKKPAQEER